MVPGIVGTCGSQLKGGESAKRISTSELTARRHLLEGHLKGGKEVFGQLSAYSKILEKLEVFSVYKGKMAHNLK